MAGYFIEKPDRDSIRRNGTSLTVTRKFDARNFETPEDVYNAIREHQIPNSISFGGRTLIKQDYDVTEVVASTDATTPHSLCRVDVTYVTPDLGSLPEPEPPTEDPTEPDPENTDSFFSFEFSSMQDRRLWSYKTDTYQRGQDVITFRTGSGINQIDPAAPPEGVDVNVPIIKMTLKRVIPENTATLAFWRALFDQVWTLNDAEWRGLPEKCVAFTGVQGELRTNGYWYVTYMFEYRPPRPAIDIPTGEQGKNVYLPETPGWTYVWAEYSKVFLDVIGEGGEETTRAIMGLRFMHVADVYQTSDFTAIGGL